MIKKIFIFIFGIVLAIGTDWAAAADVLKLSREDALKMAVATSETLKISDNNEGISKELYKQAKSAVYPQFNASAVWSNNFSYPDAVKATTDDYGFDGGVTVDQLVWAFGRVSSAIKAADEYLAATRFAGDAVTLDVAYAVALSYDNVLLAHRTYRIAEASYNNTLRNKEILHERSADGRVSRPDNIKMNADVAARVPQVNSAKIQLENSLQTLRKLIGVAPDRQIALTDDLDEDHGKVDTEKLVELLLANSPQLKAQASEIAVRRNLTKVRRAGYLPQVYAFATWDHLGVGNNASIGSDNLRDYGVAGIKVTVPIWNGGKTASEVRQALLEEQNAELTFARSREDLSEELRKVADSYNENIATLEANNEAVRLAEESFKLSQEMFSSGQVSLTDLNDAELQLTRQLLSRETTVYELNVLMAQIEKLTAEIK